MSPSEMAARYREHAAKCIKVAAGLSDTESKLALLDMAHAWLLLAEQALKNEALAVVYETPKLQTSLDECEMERPISSMRRPNASRG